MPRCFMRFGIFLLFKKRIFKFFVGNRGGCWMSLVGWGWPMARLIFVGEIYLRAKTLNSYTVNFIGKVRNKT